MAINRALMNRQMYNMGGPSLQAGAPDITLTGDMRPTYSAMRKQRLASGGIAGLKQIGKPGGLVEPGISRDFTSPQSSATQLPHRANKRAN